MVGHGGSSPGSYLADPTSPIPSHCASIVVTSTVRVKIYTNKAIVTHYNWIIYMLYDRVWNYPFPARNSSADSFGWDYHLHMTGPFVVCFICTRCYLLCFTVKVYLQCIKLLKIFVKSQAIAAIFYQLIFLVLCKTPIKLIKFSAYSQTIHTDALHYKLID